MAIASCTGAIAKSFAMPCGDPLQGGYSGRAIIFDVRDVLLTFKVGDPRTVTGITIAADKTPFAVINGGDNPFTGSNLTSTNENGMREYVKTVQFLNPKRGADASKNMDALADLPLGFIAIAEKNQHTIDGGYEVIGAYQGLKVNGDGVSRDEYANGGAFQIIASTREKYSEVVWWRADAQAWSDCVADFETLLALAPAQ